MLVMKALSSLLKKAREGRFISGFKNVEGVVMLSSCPIFYLLITPLVFVKLAKNKFFI